MRHVTLLIAAAGCLTLAAAPVAGASTGPNPYGDAAIQRQMTTPKLAQSQDTKQQNQQNQQNNKQDTGKRKSWGGG